MATTITVIITDEQASALAAIEDIKVRRAAFDGRAIAAMTPAEWAQMHISALAAGLCQEACRIKARAAGITSMDSLSEADIEAVKAARAAAAGR